MTLEDYISNPNERLNIEKINESLRELRSFNSPWSVNFYIKRGKTLEEAKECIKQKIKDKKQRTRYHPSTIEFYLGKGHDLSTSEYKVMEYKKKIGKTPQFSELILKYGEKVGTKRWKEYREKLHNRENKYLSKFKSITDAKVNQFLGKGFGNKNEKKPKYSFDDYESYNRFCRNLTCLVLLIYKQKLDPTDQKLGKTMGKNGFSVDHKFSIYGGFYHKVDPFKIAAFENLRLIPKSENSSKGQFCIIGLDEVLKFETILDNCDLSENTKERIRNVYC